MRGGLCGLVSAVALAGVSVFGLAVSGLVPTADAATGVTLYASPAGGGDCSAATSPCTLQAAVTQANGDTGDTVVLAGGTYTSVALTLTASMSLVAAPGAQPVLYGTNEDTANTIIIDSGPVSVSGLTVTNGNSGILTKGGALTVSGSTLSGNDYGITGGGDVTVTGSTLSDNNGAGLVENPETEGTATVTNSTITANGAAGIALGFNGALKVVGTTISDNGGYAIEDTDFGAEPVSVGSSIIAGNSDGGCAIGPNPFTDAGYNVESDNTCGFGSASVTGAAATAIGLGALAANGSAGPQTQAITASSDAYQLVPVSSGLCPATDERGLPRPGAGTTNCDAGAYELQYQPVTLTQAAPTTGTVTAGTAYTGQLTATGGTGTISYATTAAAAPVTVSAAGAVSASATTPAGVYQLAGTDSDALGDTGTWAFTLTVTSPGPARADLSVSITAPATSGIAAQVPVQITVTDHGPSAAARLSTALAIPKGWTVTSAGGGTVIGGRLIVFTAASLNDTQSDTYTVTLTSPRTTGQALIGAATASVTPDPSYRNNIAIAIIQVR